ncbi:hypothetical protein PybrP1_012996 [[Pythium] brassicae (nom. inval.)]|nr:hypothetical protein PybrP1_012996 [[Pythium] brassicae (nom. inval.)]
MADSADLSLSLSLWLNNSSAPRDDPEVLEEKPRVPMPTVQSTASDNSESLEDGEFGWRACYDSKRNLAFEFHTYTGEVRWLPPQRVGFVVEGTRLPAETKGAGERDDAQPAHACGVPPAYGFPDAALECWSPYYPRMVMMPSGLMELQQQHAGIEGGSPQRCDYNRFPVAWDFGAGVVAREEEDAVQVKSTLEKSPGRRILPPTWESAVEDHSPFLETHPVAVLAGVDSAGSAGEVENGECPFTVTTEAAESSAPPAAPNPVQFPSSGSSCYDASRCCSDAARGVWCYPQWTPGVMVPFWMPLLPAPTTHIYYSSGLARVGSKSKVNG